MYRHALALAISLAPVFSSVFVTSADASEPRYRILDRPFLELIGFIEGPDGYNDITGYTKKKPVKPITEMTINEVLDFQRMLRQSGEESSAVGRYQFIYKTLLHTTDVHDIDRNKLFDRKMQDHLARIEMARCGFYEPRADISEIGDCLAGVWAALPVLTGNQRGRSRYASTGINGAKTVPVVFEAILNARVIEYTPQTLEKSSGFTVKAGFFGETAKKNMEKYSQAAMSTRAPKPAKTLAPERSARPKARGGNQMDQAEMASEGLALDEGSIISVRAPWFSLRPQSRP